MNLGKNGRRCTWTSHVASFSRAVPEAFGRRLADLGAKSTGEVEKKRVDFEKPDQKHEAIKTKHNVDEIEDTRMMIMI